MNDAVNRRVVDAGLPWRVVRCIFVHISGSEPSHSWFSVSTFSTVGATELKHRVQWRALRRRSLPGFAGRNTIELYVAFRNRHYDTCKSNCQKVQNNSHISQVSCGSQHASHDVYCLIFLCKHVNICLQQHRCVQSFNSFTEKVGKLNVEFHKLISKAFRRRTNREACRMSAIRRGTLWVTRGKLWRKTWR